MKKTMLIIVGVILLLFGGLALANNYKTEKKVATKTEKHGNPYGKTDLHEATVEQLDDPLYQNQIIPKDLDKKIENNEPVTVYFYQPTCSHCMETSPIVVPLAEELDIDLKKVNLLEFNHQDYWDRYSIEGTPTIIHYENGEEVDRIVGSNDKEAFENFFEKNVIKDTE